MEHQFEHIKITPERLKDIAIAVGVQFENMPQEAFDEMSEKIDAWLITKPELDDVAKEHLATYRKWETLRKWITAQIDLPSWWAYVSRNDQAKVVNILSRNGADLEFPTRVFNELVKTRDMAAPFFNKIIYSLDRYVKEARAGVEVDWDHFCRDLATYLAVFSGNRHDSLLDPVRKLIKEHVNKVL